MDHFVVYHNPDTMNVDASEIEGFGVVTGKSVSSALGARIWVITGRGVPRRYSLVQTFVAEYAGPDTENPGFNLVTAESGQSFRPEIEIGKSDWFSDFRNSMGNVGFGFQRLKEARFIRALERASEAARKTSSKPKVRRRSR